MTIAPHRLSKLTPGAPPDKRWTCASLGTLLLVLLHGCNPSPQDAEPELPPLPLEPTTPATVAIVESFNPDPAAPENSAMQNEIIVRVDALPGLTDQVRDTLYAQIEGARGLGVIARIQFPPGRTTLSPAEAATLRKTLADSEHRELVAASNVLLIAIAWADEPTDRMIDHALSRKRAASVAEALAGERPAYAVGMSGSVLPMPRIEDQPGTAEVWVLQP